MGMGMGAGYKGSHHFPGDDVWNVNSDVVLMQKKLRYTKTSTQSIKLEVEKSFKFLA